MNRLSPPSGSRATARRPATASASATPTCGSASPTTARRPATSRSGATPRPFARARPRAGRPTRSWTSVVAGALVLDPVLGAVKADIGIKDGRIVGVGRAGNDADQRRHRAARSARTPSRSWATASSRRRAPSTATSTSSRRSSCRRRCRAASRRSSPPGSRSRRGRWRGRSPAIADWPLNVGLQACARAEDDGSLDALAGRRRVRVQDPRGLRRVSGAHRSRPALRRRARRLRLAPHRRPARERRARGHGRGHRRPDRPRLPRRGQRRRPRARRHRPRPRGERHLLIDDADRAVRASTPPPSSCR